MSITRLPNDEPGRIHALRQCCVADSESPDVVDDVRRHRNRRDESPKLRGQLQAVIDASTQVAIIATDLKGTITLFNTGAEQMLGYSANELVGLQTPHVIHLASEVIARGAQLTRETGREVHGFDVFVEYARQGRHDAREWTYVRKNGSHLTVKLVVTSIRDNDNTLTGFLGVATDVTTARQAERDLRTERERLKISEERYKLVVRGSSAGIFDWDIKTGEVFYAPRFKEMLGYVNDEFPNTRSAFEEAIHPDDRMVDQQALDGHFSPSRSPYDVEFQLRTKSGEYHFFRTRGVGLMNEQGEPHRMVGSIVDITDRKRAEAALKESEEAYRALFDSVPAAVFVCDRSGTLQRYNRRAAELWGREPHLGVEKYSGALKLYRPDGTFLPHSMNPVMEVMSTGTPVRDVEVVFERPDGSRIPVIINFDVMRNAAGEIDGSVVCFDEISHRIQAENELIAARENAEAANRTKSDFLANMSHEIRTPLTSILGYADLLTEHSLTNEERDSHVATIKRSGDHLLTIINDILDLSKIEAGKMTVERIPFSPAHVVREVLCYFQEQALTRKLTLTADASGSIPKTICSDPVRVRQILVNLVGNAIKFTEFGGIKVFVRLIEGEGNETSRLAFDVVDTGIGISDEQRAVLFAPFVQADTSTTRKFGGTGLGLTICRRMAQLLDGDISLTSVAGRGSTFTATVATGPLDGIGFIDRIVEREPQPVVVTTTTRLSGWILLAEDSPVNQHLLKTVLSKAGASVDVVENGKLALEQALLGPGRAGAGQPVGPVQSYDLVLMDMQMPILDGCSATKELRKRGFRTPIVALTANAMTEDREKCFDAGCDDFVTKPVERDHLLEVCNKWMSKHRLVAPAIMVDESPDSTALPCAIDTSALIRLVDNDLDLLENIVRLFLTDSSILMARAHAALAEGDLRQVAGAAHRLKGAVGILKAEPAYEAARSLEALAFDEDLEGVKNKLEELKTELDRLNPSLSELIAPGRL